MQYTPVDKGSMVRTAGQKANSLVLLLLSRFLVGQTYQGPIPIFGIAVGAIIPFTSCWMILD